MMVYVNGDSHTAAAEAVNQHAFAEDDEDLGYLGRLPHPANLAVSWGRVLADLLKATFKCDAESASSNARILRTARAWATAHPARRDHLMIIQWSTWERTEWHIDDHLYQINASGLDHVPESHQDQYRQWIADLDWPAVTEHWHEQIWQWHLELQQQCVPHVFFNGNTDFGSIPADQRQDWGSAYLAPYDADGTYTEWLIRHGHHTVSPRSWHFGHTAHAAWARCVLQYCVRNNLV